MNINPFIILRNPTDSIFLWPSCIFIIPFFFFFFIYIPWILKNVLIFPIFKKGNSTCPSPCPIPHFLFTASLQKDLSHLHMLSPFLSLPFSFQSTPRWPHDHDYTKKYLTKGTRVLYVSKPNGYILISTSYGLLEGLLCFLEILSISDFCAGSPGFPMTSQSLSVGTTLSPSSAQL